MKIPAAPPDFGESYDRLMEQYVHADPDRKKQLAALMRAASPTDENGRYLHWDDFRFRRLPEGLDLKSHWALTRQARFLTCTATPFRDKARRRFGFTPTAFMARRLHEIDSEAHGGLQFAGVAPKDQEAERFLINSLIEEPFSSSLLEGAATTREEAKRLIRENKKPATLSEKMVLNNYRAIEFIKHRKNDPLTIELVHELHRILATGTLDDDRKAGAFRTDADIINVVDDTTGEILHAPPPAGELPARLQVLCDFANDSAEETAFVHPIVRTIILHFMLAYDHPYVDGNGRTARALFYWSVIKDGYWLLEYISISRIINEAPIQYGKAFLHTETDGVDLTYFIHHQLDVIMRAIKALGEFIRRKQDEVKALSAALESRDLRARFNHRQLALLHDAIRSPNTIYTIADHERIHNVSYLTARADLEGLAQAGFFRKSKYGNKSLYRSMANLPRKIGALGA